MSTEIKQNNWYVLRVMGGKERKTAEAIEKEIEINGMSKFVSKVLVPTEKVYQIRNGKKVSKDRNFFPGYVLIEADLVGEVPHTLRRVPGVLGFLSSKKGGIPVPMRKAEINRILGKVDEMAISVENVNIPFVVGEVVKVIDGPFASFNGEIEQIDEDKARLRVAVSIFGRSTPVDLDYSQVEKA